MLKALSAPMSFTAPSWPDLSPSHCSELGFLSLQNIMNFSLSSGLKTRTESGSS